MHTHTCTCTDEDDHHDDVVHYLQPLSNEELIALGRELGLSNSRLTKMTDVAGALSSINT